MESHAVICRRCVNEFIDRHLVLLSWLIGVLAVAVFWNMVVHW